MNLYVNFSNIFYRHRRQNGSNNPESAIKKCIAKL